MLFNSINYFIFLPVVFITYYILPDRLRWILLLTASIIFYLIGGAATFVIPVIIVLTTFFCGILIEKSNKTGKKKTYFLTGIFINLGLLVFYKYINFFIATALDGFKLFNHISGIGKVVNCSPLVLTLIVPLGISFVTFQAIGYLIEIKSSRHKSETNIGLFATYLLFFPKLLSGPIERAHNFIPQLREKHEFNYDLAVLGLKRILWGMFLKLVIANRLAIYTDAVFNNYTHHSGLSLMVASIFFTIQLFADFAGYTDIAIGSAGILGYRLMENFDRPFIAKSVTEFWRRWHISLTTWVTDYIFNPIVISLRNWNKSAVVSALMVTFLILGFWHGASWNFIIFGLLQGIILTVEFLTRKTRKKVRNFIPAWIDSIGGIIFTSAYFCFSTIFFKANSASDAISIIKKILTFKGPFYSESPSMMLHSFLGILILLFVGLLNEFYPEYKTKLNNSSWIVRNLSYGLLVIMILVFGVFDSGQFIYFKF